MVDSAEKDQIERALLECMHDFSHATTDELQRWKLQLQIVLLELQVTKLVTNNTYFDEAFVKRMLGMISGHCGVKYGDDDP